LQKIISKKNLPEIKEIWKKIHKQIIFQKNCKKDIFKNKKISEK